MKARLLRMLPARLGGPLARHALPVTLGLVGILLVLGLALAALATPGSLGISAARLSETRELGQSLAGSAINTADSDRDGLSDSLENYLYGTDANDWNSSGLGIPDGWLAQHGFDPLSPLTREARGAAPPADALPEAYADGYPAAYTPPLADYYAYGKPAEYQPGVDAPWWRAQASADPSVWNQSANGLPTGWLLHYGLPLDARGDTILPGSESQLTVREAFEHDTDPRKLDSDGDGLDDKREIDVTHTSPAKFSTSGSGIADGWALHYELDALNADVAYQDPDMDGLTNLEEFIVSHQAFEAQVATEGVAVLYGKGLDPLDWQTAKTGIPDGWYVKYGLSPFGADVDRVIGKASEFPEVRNLASAPEGQQPLPDFVMTIQDAYEYGRPSSWSEATQGVWWGGTNPVTLDTDNDGLPDPIEIRGWYANVTFEPGGKSNPAPYKATSNPLEPDSDGDGLSDLEEYRGRVTCASGQESRAFPPTDPRNRDTAFSGLTDLEKVCGVVRGDAKYDLGRPSAPGAPFLDPTRADSAKDGMRDGQRLQFWHERALDYRASPKYPYNGSAYKVLTDWTEKYQRFAGMSRDQLLAQFRPDGDVDGDGIPNVLDQDPSGGLYVERWGSPGASKSDNFFPGGPQIDPSLYRNTEFTSAVPHSASDPANPDTDGDNLPDSWETRFGVFDAALNGWNLDPAKADSDGDGVQDDKANNDGDVVQWYGYDLRESGRVDRTDAVRFAFTNELEFLAETDPNKVSTADDGVSDGWKAFWGGDVADDTFLNLLAAEDERLGSYVIGQKAQILTRAGELGITPKTDLNKVAPGKSAGYVRMALQRFDTPVAPDACGALLASLVLAPGEKALGDKCLDRENLTGVRVKVIPIEGIHRLGWADEAALRTNPYLDDTDGDGAPDAYEAYYLDVARAASRSASHPDPANPDGTRDADGDGLDLVSECKAEPLADAGCTRHVVVDEEGGRHGAGANPLPPAGSDPLAPNGADSDFDGNPDDIESGARLGLLDPSDLEAFINNVQDSDNDTILDFRELTGWGKGQDRFPVNVRTNPNDADTDKDGLLDGDSITLDPALATDRARMAAYNASGIAHKAAGGRITYTGENFTVQTIKSRPDVHDSVFEGVPDGWLGYYYGQKPATLNLDAYQGTQNDARLPGSIPTWWSSKTHGTWWWGWDPLLDKAPAEDADQDGLNDRTGEDPFPGRFDNLPAPGILDLAEAEAWVKSGATPADVRARAQSLGDGAGDPRAARNTVHVNPNGAYAAQDRANVTILDLAVANANGGSPVIAKGVAFNVTGRVVLNERTLGITGDLLEGSAGNPVGVANRTVLVSLFGPDSSKLVGAGFTDADGRFHIRANITASQTVAIPHDGMVLLGRASGNATFTLDPASVASGNETLGKRNSLVVWVTNTSSTAQPGDPTYLNATLRLGTGARVTTHATRFAATDAFPITVRTDTVLVSSVPDRLENGGKLVGEVRLLDASGGAIADQVVTLRWTGQPQPLDIPAITNREGIINLTNRADFPVSVARADQYALTARFTSSDPNLRSAEPATFGVAIVEPTLLTATANAAGATVGDALTLEGTLVTQALTLANGRSHPSVGVADATVRASLGGVEESARTDDLGRFTLRLQLPGSLAAGTQAIALRFAGDATHAAAEASVPLAVKKTAEVVDLTRPEGPRGLEVALRGRLVDNEGQGFAGRLEVHNEGGILARAEAGERGDFSIPLQLGNLRLGTSTLRVVFPGDAGHSGAENLTQARVTSTTSLRIDTAPQQVTRGETFRALVRLLDDAEAPVAAQPVSIHWRGEKVATLVTDAQGYLAYNVPTNKSERASTASLGFVYVPGATAVYEGASAAADVQVVAGVTLTLDDASVHRGPVAFRGVLLNDEGTPVPGSRIVVTLDGAPMGVTVTARNGSYELARALPQDVTLGPHDAKATYEGSAGLARANASATWSVRSALNVTLTKLGPVVRGESAPIEGRVVDDRGAAVDATLTATLGARTLGELKVVAGQLRGSLAIPADFARGEVTLWLNSTQTPTHDALAKAVPVVVKIRPQVDVQLPTLGIRGFSFSGDVALKDDKGAPLRNTSFAYRLPGQDPQIGRTDSDGHAKLAATAPLTGDTVIALTVRGGPDVVASEYTTTPVKLVGPASPVGYAALVLAFLLLLGLAALVIVLAILRRRQLTEAREILEDAIRELLAGNEYQGTIFLAYRRFSAHLARYGYVEKATETPREFAGGVRKALPVGAVPLRELIRLFEEARYSDHAIGTEERDRAVESLAQVRNELDQLLGKRAALATGSVGA